MSDNVEYMIYLFSASICCTYCSKQYSFYWLYIVGLCGQLYVYMATVSSFLLNTYTENFSQIIFLLFFLDQSSIILYFAHGIRAPGYGDLI